jgi:hypothetical protein
MTITNKRTKTTTTYTYRKSKTTPKHCPVCGKFMGKNKSAKKK